jgi:FkbM family methyltransferase
MPPRSGLTTRRSLGVLGAAAHWTRRAGLGRALAFIVDRVDYLLMRAERPPLFATAEGVRFRGYLRHRSFLEYLAHGMASETLYRSLVLDTVETQTTFVDAGAHIGLYTALVCGKARRVIAFEPDPYNVAALRLNVARRGCGNVEIRAEAVADRVGRARFRSFRSTFSGSLAARAVEGYRELEIDLVCLDDVLEDADLEDLVVKLDIEGAEARALAGMRETIRRARVLALFVEVNAQALEAAGSSAEQLIADLLATGLDCRFVDEVRRTLVPLSTTPMPTKGNLFCRKHVRDGDDRIPACHAES